MKVYCFFLLFLFSFYLSGNTALNDTFFNKAYFKLIENKDYKSLAYILKEYEKEYPENDNFNFLTGYYLYLSRDYELSRHFFDKVKNNEELKEFAFYFSGVSAYYQKNYLISEYYLSEIKNRHYFENTKFYYLAIVYYELNNFKKFEELFESIYEKLSVENKQFLSKKYIDFAIKLKKEDKIKKALLHYLEKDPLMKNESSLKEKVDKYLKSDDEKFEIQKFTCDYYLNKFDYTDGIKFVDKELESYEKTIKKSENKKLIAKYNNYINLLKLYKVQLLYSNREYKKSLEIFDDLFDVKEILKDENYLVWYLKNIYKQNNIEKYELFYKNKKDYFKKHSEEADYLQALLYYENNQSEKANELFLKFFENHPKSKNISDIVQKAAWNYYRKGDFGNALIHYEKMSKSEEYNLKTVGLYWSGKIFMSGGLIDKGRLKWSEIINKYPLSYYANLILNQQQYLSAKDVYLLNEKRKVIINKNFEDELHNENIPEYLRFFAKYKMFDIAKYELSFLFRIKSGHINDAVRLFFARIYKEENNDSFAHWVLQRGFKDQKYPENSSYLAWSIAYPLVEDELIETYSQKAGVSPYLSLSIMRQESAFNKSARSYSNAYGLMQLLYSTAKSMQKRGGVYLGSADDLYKPEKNIPLGTAYLGYLANYFNNEIVYIIAAYNAGEGRVGKWKKQFGHLPVDEFIENIPINQTKDYCKKVLNGFISYDYLYNAKSSFNYLPLNINQQNYKNYKKTEETTN